MSMARSSETRVTREAAAGGGNDLPGITAAIVSDTVGPASSVYQSSVAMLEKAWGRIEPARSGLREQWAASMRALGEDEPDLRVFFDQTYLCLLAKAAVYLTLAEGRPDRSDMTGVLTGEYFAERGIGGLTTNDVSLWLADALGRDIGREVLRGFCDALADYDFEDVSEDIFRQVYEAVMDRDRRRSGGEYYTPTWLVQLVLDDALSLWSDGRASMTPAIFDPACGSGAFLFHAIRRLQDQGASVEAILRSVVGTDVNPVACVMARANYLIALGRGIRQEEPVSPPVEYGDSLKPPSLCLLYTSPSPRDATLSRMPSSA